MKDTFLPLRRTYYNTISGAGLTVYDEKAPGNASFPYVLLSTQTGADISPYSHFDTEATILIDIVHKQPQSVNKNAIDAIAHTIINTVIPSRGTNGLMNEPGFQILNVTKEDDRYLTLEAGENNYIIRRLIRFSQTIHEL